MKLSLDPALAPPRSRSPESRALARWYDGRPSVRRMWAIRERQGLRVIVTLEPTVDDSDIVPTWLAHCGAWARELQAAAGGVVRLELVDEPVGDAVEIDAEGTIVAAMCWRDPA
jgi:hypothetical protein